ncbi:MAG: S53 family peptidase [Chloroflexota bacterium]|nr:MAG: hypothetical protein DLM70_17075 [Chloroflexota bacterium]
MLWLLPAAVVVFAWGSARAPVPRAPSLPGCLQQQNGKVCFGPAQIRQAYDVDPLLRRGFTGEGRTIAIIVSFGSPTIRADLHAFDRAFSLPDPHLDIRSPLGPSAGIHAGWAGEASLDVEWAHVMAPGAHILLLTSPVDETEGVQGLPEFLKLERYATRHGADVISQSWAATENTLLDARGRQLVSRFHRFYATATAKGITIVGASGDDGAAGLDLTLKHFFPGRAVQYPSSDSLVLAVGGTFLSLGAHKQKETAWDRSGGGFSTLFAEPAYQQTLLQAAQQLLNGRRGLPDVALNAAKESPIAIYRNGRWALVFGTSAAVPQWAGLIALADSIAGRDLGAIQPALYRIASSPRYHADLHDITGGAILDPPGSHYSGGPLHAASGWDPATGLGTPDAAALLPDLARQPATRARGSM